MSILNKFTFKNVAIATGAVVAVGAVVYYFFNSDDTDSISELAASVTEAAAEAAEAVAVSATK